MPRGTDIKRKGFMPIIKDMDKASWKVLITDTNDTVVDVTDDLTVGSITRQSTIGVSNFSINVDNTSGKYKGDFPEGTVVDFFYDYTEKSLLTTVRMRGYIDNIFDAFGSSGPFLIFEGRDVPKSENNEHFVDTQITIQFSARNILDCWFGTVGTIDSQGNFPDGVLFNSGLILKVFDTSSQTFKDYKDLSDSEKTTLKALTGYTETHTNTYVDNSRLKISTNLAKDGDYDFRIFYDSSEDKSFLVVHPEESIVNTAEHVTAGQNLIDLGRYGRDTTLEKNRFKQKGSTVGSLLLIRTKQDTTRQAALWIKDDTESDNSLKDGIEVAERALANLNKVKNVSKKGNMTTQVLPSLQPGEKIPLNIPYIVNENIKVNTFTVHFGQDFSFDIDLQERDITLDILFKDNIDATEGISSSDNPNGLRNAIIFDFSNPSGFTLSKTQIINKVLILKEGESVGTMTSLVFVTDETLDKFELRISAAQFWNCTYRVSADGGTTFENYTLGTLHNFGHSGSRLVLEITLKNSTTGVSPEFDKINYLYS